MKKLMLGIALIFALSDAAFANAPEAEDFIPENDSDYAVQILEPRVKSQMIQRAIRESQKRTKSAARATVDPSFPKN